MKIGFNSFVLGNRGFSLEETISATKKQGANSIEISFRKVNDLLNFELTEGIKSLLESLDHISIHAPFDPEENPRYLDDEFTNNIIYKLKDISEELPIKGIVFHPTNIDDFDFMDSVDLPIHLENMDLRKKSFKNVNEFEKLKEKYNFGFVLDLEHAFENDSSLKLANELINVMGNRLKEIHISGAKKKDNLDLETNNHCSLAESEHRDDLLACLEKIEDIPVILEVYIKDNIEKNIKKEIDFVRSAIK
jgi:hypothetical protein